jgi:alpha-L-fucosidase 2
MEWYDERDSSDPHHRHISHLYALYPARLIAPRENPAFAKACKLSLDARGDEGTGWSLAWKIACRAVLGDGERAERLLKMQLRPAVRGFEVSMTGGGTYPNLFCAHPPFQIDGNFGVAAGIVEMLVSYDRENIYLLPALPASWESGRLDGFVTPWGTVSCAWEKGKLISYSVKNKKEGISLCAMGEKL